MTTAECEQAAKSKDAGERLSRWRTALHESGHAVAARHLLGRTARAVVFSDGGGVADLGGSGGVPESDEEAIAVSAGSAAELLAYKHPPPQAVPQPYPDAKYPEVASRVRTGIANRTIMLDEVAIARWCIEGHECFPRSWKRRFDWLDEKATVFVDEHELEVLETATALYSRGITTLPAEPARED